MGLNSFLGSSCKNDRPASSPSYSPPVIINRVEMKLPNPNKFRWVIEDDREHPNGWVVIKIHYLDCTNYEGRKILVFDSAEKFAAIYRSAAIDPHFSEDSYSPVARFVPTARGWDLANAFAASSEKVNG